MPATGNLWAHLTTRLVSFTVNIPKSMGAKITLLSRGQVNGDYDKRGDAMYTLGYDTAKNHLDLVIDGYASFSGGITVNLGGNGAELGPGQAQESQSLEWQTPSASSQPIG